MTTYQWTSGNIGGYNEVYSWMYDARKLKWFVLNGTGAFKCCFYAVTDDYGTLVPVQKLP